MNLECIVLHRISEASPTPEFKNGDVPRIPTPFHTHFERRLGILPDSDVLSVCHLCIYLL